MAGGGTLGITVNRMPYFAKLDKNIINASGFSGHGVAIATIAGKLVAELIEGQASRFDAMEQVPTYPFPGGRHLRHALLVMAMLYYKTRDKIGSGLANRQSIRQIIKKGLQGPFSLSVFPL